MAQQTVFEILYNLKDNASKKFQSASKRIDTSAVKTTKSVGGAGKAMNMLGMAVKAFVALAAIRQFSMWMKETIRLAAVQEAAINKLNAALSSSGDYSAETSIGLQKFASELQKITTVGDETSLGIMATIKTLTKLDEEGLKKATKATIGVAKALKMDLNAAAITVGKSIGSSTNALVRYGVMLDATATETEKVAQITEATAGMFEIAKAEANTFSGAVEQLKNSYGDWREEIGLALIQNKTFITMIQQMSGMFSDRSIEIKDAEKRKKELDNNMKFADAIMDSGEWERMTR